MSESLLTKRAELVETNRQLAQRVQELQTLFEVGKSVTSQLDLDGQVFHPGPSRSISGSCANERSLPGAQQPFV